MSYKRTSKKKISALGYLMLTIFVILLIIIKSCTADNRSPTSSDTTDSINAESINYSYLLNPETKIIHRYNCYTIKHKENFLRSNDYGEAIEKGYRPCEVCDPE